MKQVTRLTVNYAADLAGVDSVLYELGGLLVMHDASGCNSTYATHDEPRWYDSHSLIYISGLTEYDAILGNDDKLIDDVVEAAKETHPNFIAVFGSPIALIMGTDFKGIAHVIEHRTGIPTFGFKTSGMKSYIQGARQALNMLADHYCQKRIKKASDTIKVNIIGVTPLDFGLTGNVEALTNFCQRHGFEVQSQWAMNNTLEQIAMAGNADVNWVVSSMGLDAAKTLQKKFGMPYVEGLPIGKGDIQIANLIQKAYQENASYTLETKSTGHDVVIIGEPVCANSIRYALDTDKVQIICPTEIHTCLCENDVLTHDEKDIKAVVNQAKMVIADPIYKRLINKENIQFIDLPYIAYSGRMFQDQIPIFIGPDGLEHILKNNVHF